VFAVVYSLRFGHDVFFGPPPTDCPRQPHEPVHWMRVPVELLVLACMVVGTLPAWSMGPGAGTGRAAGGGRHAARLQPGGLARLQHAAADEPGGHGGGLLVYLRFAARFKQRRGRGAPLLQGWTASACSRTCWPGLAGRAAAAAPAGHAAAAAAAAVSCC
jgi:multicomponent K+:H+ antiporter subunit A